MFSFEDYGIDTNIVILSLLAAVLILLVLIIVLFVKQHSTNKHYRKFMSGKNGESLEDAFEDRFANMEKINYAIKDINVHLSNIDTNLLKTYQKVGMVKYDAFQEIGGKMSFALALLTKDNDGFILNSMHSNREGCFTYVKEVAKGEVFVTLSEEETMALDQAKNNK